MQTRDVVHTGLFVAGSLTDFRIECRRPCGTGASNAPIRRKPASPMLQPSVEQFYLFFIVFYIQLTKHMM
jgi:hypothetical protein